MWYWSGLSFLVIDQPRNDKKRRDIKKISTKDISKSKRAISKDIFRVYIINNKMQAGQYTKMQK